MSGMEEIRWGIRQEVVHGCVSGWCVTVLTLVVTWYFVKDLKERGRKPYESLEERLNLTFSFFFKILLALGLHCCPWASSSWQQ